MSISQNVILRTAKSRLKDIAEDQKDPTLPDYARGLLDGQQIAFECVVRGLEG